MKTCPEKIENKSYHHRRILRPILADGNVNKVSFEMMFKRSESLCFVLKPLENEQKIVPYSVLDVLSRTDDSLILNFLKREHFSCSPGMVETKVINYCGATIVACQSSIVNI